jgi:hypothetical protein
LRPLYREGPAVLMLWRMIQLPAPYELRRLWPRRKFHAWTPGAARPVCGQIGPGTEERCRRCQEERFCAMCAQELYNRMIPTNTKRRSA